jgi:hypothetical protein
MRLEFLAQCIEKRGGTLAAEIRVGNAGQQVAVLVVVSLQVLIDARICHAYSFHARWPHKQEGDLA